MSVPEQSRSVVSILHSLPSSLKTVERLLFNSESPQFPGRVPVGLCVGNQVYVPDSTPPQIRFGMYEEGRHVREE